MTGAAEIPWPTRRVTRDEAAQLDPTGPLYPSPQKPPRPSPRVAVDLFRDVPRPEGVQYPAYMTEGACAFDLRAAVFLDARGRELTAEARVMTGGEIAWVGTGIRVASPLDWGIEIIPRSGTGAKQGLVLANGTGLIDSDYRGELKVPLWNRRPRREGVTRITLGERIAQARLVWAPQAWFEFSPDLDITKRDADGFGSTGSE